jgi:hypothetical protein
MNEQDKQEQSAYELSEEHQEHEQEVEVVTGRVDAENQGAFAGTDAVDAQVRRLSRRQFLPSDRESPQIDQFNDDTYVGPRTGAEVKTYDEFHSYLTFQDERGRERHPDWDKVLGFVLAKVKQEVGNDEGKKAELREMLLEHNVGERWYAIGSKWLKDLESRAPTQEELAEMEGPEVGERLQEWVKGARSRDDEDQPDIMSRREMKRRNRMSLEDFAAELDADKARGR